jgi:putative phosphoribosyl transferase
MFRDREQAGRLLGAHLRERLAGPAVVLGIPRGGVVVAAPVALALGAPLDIVVPRKIGAPGQPELAIGAVALAGDEQIVLTDADSVRRLGVDEAYLAASAARERREIERRLAAYREGRPAVPLAGATAVIVDDGIATGLTARAAAEAVARQQPVAVVIAAPVAPEETLREFRARGIRIEVLRAPAFFMAVGQYYEDFEAVPDAVVREVLRAVAAR